MKILVTGAGGFIGRNFCRSARQVGHIVVGIDKKDGRDVNDLQLTCSLNKSDLAGIEGIVHLAANCSTPRSIARPIEDFRDNAHGTLAVLEFARRRGVPLVYTSTCKVYSARAVNALNGAPVDESVSVIEGPRTPYGTSKLVGELYCQEYSELYGMQIVIDRLSSVFGLDQDGSEEAGWLHWFIRARRHGLPISIYGTGEQVRDVLWVDDLCQLLLDQISHVELFAGHCFNVGGGPENAISLNWAINYLKRKAGPPLAVQYAQPRPVDLNVYISDMRGLFQVCDWRPYTKVADGIDLIYESIPDCVQESVP